ncbi:MAG TPA: hypothetical protein VNX68_05655, partial [Nitrosopumilaceae archaeon]|nr:hypothetical protein [Nitrosopumilaceae archaeon]
EENPFIPIAWQKDHKGMQGTEYCDDKDGGYTMMWLEARDNAIKSAKQLSYSTLTKQLCNRLLEPFMWHTVILTATEFENFFALRCPKYIHSDGDIEDDIICRSKKDCIKNQPQQYYNWDYLMWGSINKGQAEIHMMALAEAMWDTLNESTPKELKAGEWHIPFGDNVDMLKFSEQYGSMEDYEEELVKIKIATARCARVSYTVVGEEDKEPNYKNDIKLHDRLREAGHMSPFEHCAQAMPDSYFDGTPANWSGNLKGFTQYRKTLPNENITKL